MTKLVSIRSGATALPEQSVAHLVHDLIGQSGVVNLSNNDWKVSEANPEAMSVQIAVGRGYFKKTSMTYHGYTDAVESVEIAANNEGNARISAIVAYLDLSATPNADGSGVLVFDEVAGTADASPVAPTDNEIQTAIGAGNPFIRLADITVDDGETAIQDADITDQRVGAYLKVAAGIYETLFKKSQMAGNYQRVKQVTSSGAVALDCAEYNVFEITMTGDVTVSVSNMQVGQFIQIDFIQDGTGGRTPTLFSTIKWEDDISITSLMNKTANKCDSIVIKKTGTDAYKGYIAALNQ